MRARKKPIVVDVWQLDTAVLENDMPVWVRKAWNKGILDYSYSKSSWVINTLEGNMYAHDGDYLIKGIRGELYPCRHDIFLDTYEEYYDWTD